MTKPHNLEVGVWKENVLRKPAKRVKPMSAMLIKKYQRQLEEDRMFQVTRGIKWDRFFEATVYRGVSEVVGVALYRPGTRDKAKSPVC
jgi:hypothetical protein